MWATKDHQAQLSAKMKVKATSIADRAGAEMIDFINDQFIVPYNVTADQQAEYWKLRDSLIVEMNKLIVRRLRNLRNSLVR